MIIDLQEKVQTKKDMAEVKRSGESLRTEKVTGFFSSNMWQGLGIFHKGNMYYS
jgi:hypothetical protein